MRLAPSLSPSLSPTMSARQAQRQSVTPRLAQAIGMIALDPGELDALVAEHVERNPFLSRPASASRGLEAAETHAAQPTAHERLQHQIALAFVDPADAALAARLPDELDGAGYLREEDGTLAVRLGVPAGAVAYVRARCRGFEPHGLFARDLADCLALQLDARDELDAGMRAVLDHLPLLAGHDLDALRRATGLAPVDLAERIRRLRRCDPKPGAGMDAPPSPTIRPVARIVPDGRGGWSVRLLSHAFPSVVLDEDYAAAMSARPEAAAFARAALREARWLDTALRRRARTLDRVVKAIVARQSDFLDRGEAALRPLTIAALAATLGLHETTVGRAVTNKSVETPRGTVALRAFFGSGIAAPDGALAARAVALRIRDLVRAERPDAVLSDDRLSELLQAEGIPIARRTVAKYRDMLSIGSSAQRRRAHRAARTELFADL